MSDTVIQVENLGKKYVIGHQQAGAYQYNALRDVITDGVRSLGRKIRHPRKAMMPPNQEEFWALKDVSFEVKRGEVVGIIGRNGAGKSTLLKLLSRITEPTTGRIKLKGRVASLLEVGTGFHPELTGRENIFLNGAILGMSKAEINRKFDEIVEFAEISRFLDTPVKRYSSGMYVRLAFAVAAHLEPEILVVDEVLAVGDVTFQKKCLGKMQNVGREGRTVLFVSHNMSAIEFLCGRGVVLESGRIAIEGSIESAINFYLEQASDIATNSRLYERKDRKGSGKVKAIDFQSIDTNEKSPVLTLQSGRNYTFKITCENKENFILKDIVVSLDFYDERGNRILLFRSNFTNSALVLPPGISSILCKVNDFPLAPGSYSISIFLSCADSETLDFIQTAAVVTVEGGDFFGTGNSGMPSHCKVLTRADWLVK